MKQGIITAFLLNSALLLAASNVDAIEKTSAMKLVYVEAEPGVDPYTVTYTVSSDYIRIDDESDSSGFIVYDDKAKRIYSVSHFDKSILVIAENPAAAFEPDFKIDIEYNAIDGAPKISGKDVYNYQVKAITSVTSETCMDIQLVPGLLPDVSSALQAYQKTLSGQHAGNLEKTPEQFRTPCYLVDQVHNHGDYYSKGLPVLEWHSNGKKRQLMNYKETEVDTSLFTIPAEYRQYSLK